MNSHDDDDLDDVPVPTAAPGGQGTPPDDLPPAASRIAAAALQHAERRDPAKLQTCTALSPTLLWQLAAIVAAIITQCAKDKLEPKLQRARLHPDGMLARRMRKKLAARLPETLDADHRDYLAASLITAGTEAAHDPRSWQHT